MIHEELDTPEVSKTDYRFEAKNKSIFVVVVLLFYVHGKHLRSCRDGQLT